MAYRRSKVEVVEDLFDADAIFRAVKVAVTPELVAFYRGVSPWAILCDRQSLGRRVLGNPDQTGHKGRVAAIVRTAERLGYYLPAPVEVEVQEEGQLPFVYDARLHYVDGCDGPASGLSFSPHVRPRLWHAYALARRLRELDAAAAPKAILVASPERFTRADQWLKCFVQAFHNEGVEVHLGEYGRVEPAHLDLIGLHIRVLSEALPRYIKAAKEVARREGKVWHGQVPFGLEFRNGRREVWTVPQEYALVWGLIHGLAGETFQTLAQAAQWTRREFGDEMAKGEAWIRYLLRGGSWVEGTYLTHTTVAVPCRRHQARGPLTELSFTPAGTKR